MLTMGFGRTLIAIFGLLLTAGAHAFGFEDVSRQAEALARQPHRTVAPDPALAALSYDDYRQIRFRPEAALWRGQPHGFELQFFPRGRGNTRPLTLYELVDGEAQPLVVPGSAFRNDKPGGPPPADGAAGWRLHYPLNRPGQQDELAVFLGASYFRVLAPGLQYGLSARGLAIDTTGGAPEEFPAFTTFWLERPAADARELQALALLESPRATGAYRFVIRPGQGPQGVTQVDVQARIHLRAPVRTLGLAPLTSMFLHGETQRPADDYRPEVHDSDGLQVQLAQGEQVWRPLINPPGTFVTSYASPGFKGWGLMQRDRLFARYEDLEARYERRPSTWVEPLGDWGPGRVELLQFHAPDETHDNIGAFWVPDASPQPGQVLERRWRLHVGGEGLQTPTLAWVTQSRHGLGYREGPLPPNRLQFHIDFQGPGLDGLSPEQVQAVVSASGPARGLQAVAQPHAVAGGWRVTLDLERIDPRQALELRLHLAQPAAANQPGRVLSETWSFALPPDA